MRKFIDDVEVGLIFVKVVCLEYVNVRGSINFGIGFD